MTTVVESRPGGRWVLPWLAVVVVVVGLAGRSLAEGGRFRPRRPYLPAVGPAPLRLQSPPEPGPRLVLPPLPSAKATVEGEGDAWTNEVAAVPGPVVPVQEPWPEAVPVATTLVPMAPVASVAPVAPGSAAAVESAATGLLMDPVVVSSSPTVVTPQMLVRFFRPTGSNLLGGGWSMPVFVPPSASESVSASRSSSATYRSP